MFAAADTRSFGQFFQLNNKDTRTQSVDIVLVPLLLAWKGICQEGSDIDVIVDNFKQFLPTKIEKIHSIGVTLIDVSILSEYVQRLDLFFLKMRHVRERVC